MNRVFLNATFDNADRHAVKAALEAASFQVADPWSVFAGPPVFTGVDWTHERVIAAVEDNGDVVDFSIATQDAVAWCEAMVALSPVDETVAAVLGMAHGRGVPCYILVTDPSAPSLAYTFCDAVLPSVADVMLALDGRDPTEENGIGDE